MTSCPSSSLLLPPRICFQYGLNLLLSFFNLFMSLLTAFADGLWRELNVFARCTPVVCTGGPRFDRPPSKSVRPPRAVKLVRAFNAPGFESNCANGIADASAAAFDVTSDEGSVVAETVVGAVVDGIFPLLLEFPVPAFADCSCVRFAFCSSTLWDKRKDREKKNIWFDFLVKKGSDVEWYSGGNYVTF